MERVKGFVMDSLDAARRESKVFKDSLEAMRKEKATASQLTVNVIVGCLGTGILSLPWATAGASIVLSVIIIAAVLIVTYWTLMIIVSAGEEHQTFDLGSLLAKLPDQRMGCVAEFVTNVTLWISSYFVLVGYFIVIADSVGPITGGVRINRALVVGATAVLALPLCFLNQRKLSWSSSLAVIVCVYIFAVFVVLYWNQASHPSDLCYLGMSPGAFAMISAMMQTSILQKCILPIYKELEDRSPEKFSGVLRSAFIFLFFSFASFSVLAYMLFGPGVGGDVLNNLPGTIWGNLARVAATLKIFTVFPIVLLPMISPVDTYFEQQSERLSLTTGVPSNVCTAVSVARIITVLLVMIGAYFFADLGFMNVLNGALSIGIFVAVCPALIGLYLLPKQNGLAHQTAMLSLLLIGLVISILGVRYTDNYDETLKGASCLWGSVGTGNVATV